MFTISTIASAGIIPLESGVSGTTKEEKQYQVQSVQYSSQSYIVLVLEPPTVTTPTGVTKPSASVLNVTIDGQVYSPSEVSNSISSQGTSVLKPQTFFYDEDLEKIIVVPSQDLAPELIENETGLAVITIPVPEIANNLITDTTGLSFLSEFNYTGTIELTRSFQGQPTGTLKIIVKRADLKAVREATRASRELTILGVGYIVSSPTIEYFGSNVSGVEKCIITLQLTGKWSQQSTRSVLDNPIKLTDTNYITFDQLASKIGINYVGSDFTAYFPKEKVTIVNPRQIYEENAISTQGFIYYSNPNAIEIKPYRQPLKTIINDYQIKQESISEPNLGFGALYGDVQLLEEFRNVKVSFPSLIDASIEDLPLTSFEKASRVEDLEKPLFELDNYSVDFSQFRSASATHANSSNKRKIIVTWKSANGVTTAIEEVTYGYKYISYEPYLNTFGNLVFDDNNSPIFQLSSFLDLYPFWGIVERTTTRRYFDDDGYYTGQITQGYKLAQITPETGTEALEAYVELQTLIEDGAAQADIDKQQAIVDNFDWYEQPVLKVQSCINDSLTDYYSDVTSGDDGVLPKYRRLQQTVQKLEVVRPNPESEEDNKKPEIHSGIDFEELIAVDIQTPNEEMTSPEVFREVQAVLNNEGLYKVNQATLVNTTENNGRPSIAERLISYDGFDLQAPVVNYGKGIKYFLRSEGSDIEPLDDIERGSVTYPNIWDIDSALAISEVDLSMKNIGTQQITLNLSSYLGLNEGDIVSFQGTQRIVTNISTSITIDQQRLFLAKYEVTLGRFLFPSVTLTELL